MDAATTTRRGNREMTNKASSNTITSAEVRELLRIAARRLTAREEKTVRMRSGVSLGRGELLPPDAKCLLRRSVVQRLALAADALRKQGLRLVARDCTRPPESQRVLWRAYPQAGAVADPSRGSLHARGVAVDLELADLSGAPVELPTKFDAFGPDAAADAPLPDGPAKEHREALKTAMHEAGFRVNPKEWWHYSRLYGWRWPVAESP